MTDVVERFVTALESKGSSVRQTAPGAHLAQCPSHEDRHPSLSIGTSTEGNVLVNCQAGCPTEDVVQALGWTMAELFADHDEKRRQRDTKRTTTTRKPDPLPSDDQLRRYRWALCENAELLATLRERRGWTVEALTALDVGYDAIEKRVLFPIHNGDGELVNVIGYASKSQPKSLALYKRPRDLFPRPESIDGDVLLVEGEGDAVAGASAGLPAVGIPGVEFAKSVEKWAPRFKGRRVTVCFDCDDAGRGAAEKAAPVLNGYASEVRVLDLGGSDGYDLGAFVVAASSPQEAGREIRAKGAAVTPLPRPGSATGTLLEDVRRFVTRFVAFASESQSLIVAAWVLHTWTIDAADSTPYLEITSAEKKSGKTRLLEVLQELASRPYSTANISDAALFRVIGSESSLPTLLFDEVDAIFGQKARDREDLRGMLNSGHRRGASVLRCVGEGSKQSVEKFPVFCAKALAGIGELPETIADRSLPIRLRRRGPGEPIERARQRRIQAEAQPLRDRLTEWAAESLPVLDDAEPALPDALDDRAQDAAEPLLAIAELASGDWPKLLSESLVELRGNTISEDSIGVRLLADLQATWREKGDPTELRSKELYDALNELEESPWASFRDGKGISGRQLANNLRRYAIGPHPIASGTARGYKRDQFEDAWSRYLTPAAPETGLQVSKCHTPRNHGANSDSQSVIDENSMTHGNGDFSHNHGGNDTMTLGNGDQGGASGNGTLTDDEYAVRYRERQAAAADRRGTP